MQIPIPVLDAITTATSIQQLLDLLLRILNLSSREVERLERKWDIKQKADFQSAVQLLRLSGLDAENIENIDLDLLKRGLADLLKSWNYYTKLYHKGILDKSVELELVYIISGWLIAKCYLKIQQCEGREELVEDAVRYYLRIMDFVQERINFIKNPPLPQPFHNINMTVANFISSGIYLNRLLKAFLIIGILCFLFFISIPYIFLNILSWINHRTKVNRAILNKLEEMYFKSLAEVAPFISPKVLQKAVSSDSSDTLML